MQQFRTTSAILVLVCVVHALAGQASAQSFAYSDFSNVSQLSLNGDAAPVVTGDGPVLRVVPARVGQVGSFYFTSPVFVGRFSSHFSFRITRDGGVGSDGLTFLVQRMGPTALGIGGGGLGFEGLGPRSAGFEFDTFQNAGKYLDPDGNHLAGVSAGTVMHRAWNPGVPVAEGFDDGMVWHAWVDYDGETMELRLARTAARPSAPEVAYARDLIGAIGGGQALVGFTAATGGGFANFDVLTWEFSSHFAGLEQRNASPGWVGFRAFDLQPGDHAAFVFGTSRGFEPIPAGSACAGTLLGLAPSPVVRALRRAGPQGRTVWDYVYVPPVAHGRSFVQAVNFTACETSNVLAL